MCGNLVEIINKREGCFKKWEIQYKQNVMKEKVQYEILKSTLWKVKGPRNVKGMSESLTPWPQHSKEGNKTYLTFPELQCVLYIEGTQDKLFRLLQLRMAKSHPVINRVLKAW